jgi:hypothetical protein
MIDIAWVADMNPTVVLDSGDRYILSSASYAYILTSDNPIKSKRFKEGEICEFLYDNGAKYSRDVVTAILKHFPDLYF